MVAHSLWSLAVVQNYGLVVGCLHAWDNQENVAVGFTLDVLPFFDRFLHAIFLAKAPRVILSIIELEQICPNHRHR